MSHEKNNLLIGFIGRLLFYSTTFLFQPTYGSAIDSKVQQMSRNEVIQATMECEGNGMRAVPILSKRLVSGMMSDIIIDVQCMPKLRLSL